MTESNNPKSLLCFALCIDEFIVTIRFYYSVREKELHFGKSWNYSPLKENEMIISTSLADSTNTHIGDQLTLSINISKILSEVDESRLDLLVNNRDVNFTKLFLYSFFPQIEWILFITI